MVARYHANMTKHPKESDFDKFKRYREARKASGQRLLRIWVPDPRAAAFRKKAARQAALLRGAPEESDALSFIEKAADTSHWTS
jgi:hypothetical protein